MPRKLPPASPSVQAVPALIRHAKEAARGRQLVAEARKIAKANFFAASGVVAIADPEQDEPLAILELTDRELAALQKAKGRGANYKARVVAACACGFGGYSTRRRWFGDDLAAIKALGSDWLEDAFCLCVRVNPRLSNAVPAAPTIWYHGGRSYSTDGRMPKFTSQEMHILLKQFCDKDEALDTVALCNAGVNNVADVVSKVLRKFGKRVGRRPTREAKGDGYFFRVRSAAPSN